MYEWIGWVLIAIGTIGCFLPVLPGPPIAYAALFLALARGDHSSPEVSTFVVAGLVMAVVLVLDWIVPALGARKFNCSRLGMLGCFIGTIAGLFFLPLGVVAGPFLGALAGEMVSGKPFGMSLKGAWSTPWVRVRSDAEGPLLRIHRLPVLAGDPRLVGVSPRTFGCVGAPSDWIWSV